jgi:hypothetical protein
MWSGPRNISTAMMRSFESRADTVVVDEPLYAHYLAVTGLDHPGRTEVLASQPTDWRDVAATLVGPLPPGATVFYQKHMTHHLLPGVGRDWLAQLTHAFLIRDPDEVINSYARVREDPTLDDLGVPQQLELFLAYGGPVIDARDVLTRPEPTLRLLCDAVGIAFDPAMLHWKPGTRPTDGVWAPYWYDAVERSTSFAPYRRQTIDLPDRLRPLAEAARPAYEELRAHRLA